MADWNSELYLKFKSERTQPAIDLANRIPLAAPARILDIGCGPGNSTKVLAERFPNARVIGTDNSPEMLEKAKRDNPALDFCFCDAGGDVSGLGEDYDVVFSNACIQWIPDHAALLPRLLGLLRPGGVLAVQTPMNYEEPIHKIIGELAGSPRWRESFPQPRIFYNLKPEEYFDLLTEAASDFTLWQTTYYHCMPAHEAILDWYRSTGLRPYLDALPPEQQLEFEQAVLERVREEYPLQRDGRIIFRFPRFFFLAVR